MSERYGCSRLISRLRPLVVLVLRDVWKLQKLIPMLLRDRDVGSMDQDIKCTTINWRVVRQGAHHHCSKLHI